MSGYANGQAGDYGIMQWKVGHKNAPNNIPQMQSACFQAPFIAGGNQVAYYLGLKGNTDTQPTACPGGCYSTYIKVKHAHRRKK
jgi:hypothetical protein